MLASTTPSGGDGARAPIDLDLAHELARQMALAGSVFTSLSADDVAAHLEAANDVDPWVIVIPRVRTRSWPKYDDAPHVTAMPLSLALETEHDTDALVLQYRSERGALRLAKEALDEVSPVLVVFPIDVDCPAELKVEGLAPEAWLAVEREKVDELFARHPGGVYYPTRGGYRVLYRLRERPIASEADAATWTATFKAHLAYVEREFGIVGDRAMAAWGQPCKLPRVPNAKVRGGVIEGDVHSVGLWSYVPSEAEIEAQRETKRTRAKTSGVSSALLSKIAAKSSGSDPWLDRGLAVGVIGRELSPGKFAATCPRKVHADNESQTAYFRGGGFKCFGAECAHLTTQDFYRFVASKEAKSTALADVPDRIALAFADAMAAPVVGVLPTGTGKSFAIRALATKRARMAVLVPTHALAREQDSALREEHGIQYAHHAAVTKPTNEREPCARLAEAEAIEAMGLSVRKVMCSTCPQYKSCAARKEPKGVAPIAPQQLTRQFVKEGRALVFDEQFPITEAFDLTAKELALANRAVNGIAGKAYSALLMPWVRHLLGYEAPTDEALKYANEKWCKPKGGRFAGVSAGWVARVPPRVDPSLPFPELARACADCADATPDQLRPRAVRTKKDVSQLHALAALAKVRRAARAGAKIERSEDGGTLHVRILSEAAAGFRDGGGLVLSATPNLLGLQALRPELRVVQFAVPDEAKRTLIDVGAANTRALDADRDRLRHYFELVVSKATDAGCMKLLIVVASTLEPFVQSLAAKVTDIHVEVEHYGQGIIGRDEWKGFDAFATIGENWHNLPEVEDEALFLGIEDANAYARQRVEADLAQAHGRARDPRRAIPAHHWHVGRVWPAGWTAENTVVEAPPCHRTARPQVMSSDDLRQLVKRSGPQREVAKALGIPQTTLSSYTTGKAVAPTELVDALVKLAG